MTSSVAAVAVSVIKTNLRRKHFIGISPKGSHISDKKADNRVRSTRKLKHFIQ